MLMGVSHIDSQRTHDTHWLKVLITAVMVLPG